MPVLSDIDMYFNKICIVLLFKNISAVASVPLSSERLKYVIYEIATIVYNLGSQFFLN